MKRKQLPIYLLAAAGVAAVLVLARVPLATLLPLAVLFACPLMMIFMMRGMSSMGSGEDHTGHGCEHDPTRHADRTRGHQR